MPKYTVVALEKFLVRTTYHDVEADSPAEAEEAVRQGQVAYDEHSICDGDDEYISVQEIEGEDRESYLPITVVTIRKAGTGVWRGKTDGDKEIFATWTRKTHELLITVDGLAIVRVDVIGITTLNYSTLRRVTQGFITWPETATGR